jgi:hypothetical protein
MGSPNGGIIGVINPTSFGKDTVTSVTASGPLTTQPGTRVVLAVVAGGGGAVELFLLVTLEEVVEQVVLDCFMYFQFVEQHHIQLQLVEVDRLTPSINGGLGGSGTTSTAGFTSNQYLLQVVEVVEVVWWNCMELQ